MRNTVHHWVPLLNVLMIASDGTTSEGVLQSRGSQRGGGRGRTSAHPPRDGRARFRAGVEADIKRVPELIPEEVAKQSEFKLDQKAPIATIAELAHYDAIIFGSGTRFGVFTSQMRNFLDQTGPLWMKGALVGKVGSVFTGSGTQHGGQESTILSMIPTLLHHGMIVVGLPYSFQGQSTMEEISGCSPYGASTITKPDGSRMPSENELAGARFQGRHVAQIASKLRA